MVGEKEDLGLCLGLSSSSAENRLPLQLNLMPGFLGSPSPASFPAQKAAWNDFFASQDKTSEIYRGDARSFLRGIDVNRMPSTADTEEEAAVSSPNSTVSSGSGKRSERDRNSEEHEIERASSRGISDEEDGDGSRKKLRLSKDQSAILEESFKEHNTLNPKQKLALAKQLNLRPRQVEVWFQNRRARTKLKQTGRLRVSETMLRKSNRREQETSERGSGAKGFEALPTVLHANDPSYNTHHVPLMRESGRRL